MPQLATPLTDQTIKAKKPEAKPYRVSDGGGLSLQINPNGTKQWRFRYRCSTGGGERMLALGTYPATTLRDARSAAADQRALLEGGADPSEQRKQNKAELQRKAQHLFKSVGEEWYKLRLPQWAIPTAKRARGVLDSAALKPLADKSIDSVTSKEVRDVLGSIYVTAPRTAVKARQFFNQIILLAIDNGYREEGKLLSLNSAFPKDAKRNTKHFPAITNHKELPALIKAIKGIGSVNSRTALWVCLYTASRPGVVAGMRWDEVSLEGKEWHIPAARMKTSNDHISPLPTQLVEQLKIMKQDSSGSPFVFEGARDPLTTHMHRDSLSKVLRENGLRDIAVTHGFRATFRTIARERLKADVDVLEAQLAHAKRGEVAAAYDRTQLLDERHELIQKWADYVDAVASEAKVVAFPHKASS